MTSTLPITARILLIRKQRVILDADLAELYGVQTKALNQAIKRNLARFPSDFMWQLSATEKTEVVTNCDHLAKLKYSRTLPVAFTEHGAIQAANVLNSARACELSVYVVRAFVQLRETLSAHKDLAQQLLDLERRLEGRLSGHDRAIRELIGTMKQLMTPPIPKKRPIGFIHPPEDD